MSSTLGIVAFVASIVIAIVIHELGHLLTAKRAGMRADRFFVGFGPTLWSTRRGETEYGLKAILLGGYVRIMGMSPDDDLQAPIAAALPDAPDGTDRSAWWAALATELKRRGANTDQVRRITDTTRGILFGDTGDLGDGADESQYRSALERAIGLELGASRRVGDLVHRLLEGDRGRLFVDRPAWQRTVVLVSGPASHLLIAFGLLLAVQVGWAQPTGELTSIVAAVRDGSPAAEAGIEAGDRLVAVDGIVSDDFIVLRDALRERVERPTVVTVSRDGRRLSLPLVPEAFVDPATQERIGLIGIATTPETVRVGLVDGAIAAAVGPSSPQTPGGVVPMIGDSVRGLVRILSPSGLAGLVSQATGRTERAPDGAVSLVGAASIAGQVGAREGGLPVMLTLLAAINVFFFLFNLVPLPPFDGGHLAVVGVESTVNTARRLRGRAPDFRVRPEALGAIAVPVIAVLVLLLVATLWLDLTDPIRL
jgi:regulator of sigma E protease